MEPSEYSCRFIEHNDFIELAKKLEINIDQGSLEFFEKKKLLFPRERLILDREYVKYMGAILHDPSSSYYTKHQFALPDKWVPLHNFITSIKDYPSIWTYHTFFHTLDHDYPSEKKFKKNVTRSRFHRWESYKIAVAAHEHGEYKELTVRNLYSYWQIYSVYEIQKAYTLSFFVDLTDKKTIEAFWKWKIPKKKIRRFALPSYHKYEPGDFSGHNNDYEPLAFYAQCIRRLDQKTLIDWNDQLQGKDDLSMAASSRYNNNQKRFARVTIRKYDLSKEQLFNFLKYLCKKYFDLIDDKKDKLSEMLKKDIYNLVYLISDGFELEVDVIRNTVGRVTYHFENTLDGIFPDEIKNAKEKALETMMSYINANSLFKSESRVDKNAIEKLFSYLEEHNLFHFFLTLSKVSEEWFSSKFVAQSNRQSYAIYLAIFIETLLKELIKSYSNDANIVEERRFDLYKSLEYFYKNEIWWKKICQENLWQVTQTDGKKMIEIILRDEILVKNFDSTSELNNETIKMFLICGLVRNYSAHKHQDLFPLDHEAYHIIFSNLVSSVWYCWNYARKKKPTP
jgi:hypothetical protein